MNEGFALQQYHHAAAEGLWQHRPGKSFLREVDRRSVTGAELVLGLSAKHGVIPRAEMSQRASEATSYVGYKLVQAGQLISNKMQAWNGMFGISQYNGITSPDYAIYEFRQAVEPRFIQFIVQTKLYAAEFHCRSKGIGTGFLRLNPSDFLSVPYWLPKVSKQRGIADFLDRETDRIDSLIEKKLRFTALLKEKQSAVIANAVTKGLDPAVAMKNSGIDWIGEIPASWRLMKLGFLGRCANGINVGGDAFGSGFPFVSYGDVYKNRKLPEEVIGLVQSTKADRAAYSVKAGDVFFTRTSETVEEIGFSSACLKTIEDAVFAGFLIRFRPFKDVLVPEFSKFAFQNASLRDFFASEMMLVTRASLSQNLLQSMPVPVPSIEEQARIAKYLENTDGKVASIIKKTERSIELLRENRSALITAAVTGQIDVATWVRKGETDRRLDRIQEEMSQKEARA